MTGIFGATSCAWCQSAQRAAVLVRFGNRCKACYDAFCAEGWDGGPKGFIGGAADTDQQKEMRKRLKANRPVGHAMTTSQDDAKAREKAKVETARRVAEYQRSHQ